LKKKLFVFFRQQNLPPGMLKKVKNWFGLKYLFLRFRYCNYHDYRK